MQFKCLLGISRKLDKEVSLVVVIQDNDKLPAFRVFRFLLLTVNGSLAHDRAGLIHVNIITSFLPTEH